MSDSVLTGTNSGDTLNGSAGSNVINGGAGNDTIDGGGGDDRLNAGSGADTLIYRLSENLTIEGTADRYTGGSGVDTVQLVFTRDEWASQEVQDQINAYLTHLAAATNPTTGEVSNATASDFTFHFEIGDKSSTLTVSMIENVEWLVQPALSVENASGSGDDPISLDIAAGLTDPDGSDSLTITISGVPDGWTLSAGEAVAGHPGTYVLSAEELAGLKITPPAGTVETIALTVTATATESSTGATTSTSTSFIVSVSQSDAVQGRVIDGYIVDATVFADADNDGVLDTGEASTTTDATGNFTLIGGSGPLVMFGGTDISTRLPFEGVLRAPAPDGVTNPVITPLTTLIAELVDQGQTLAQATGNVVSALGLVGTIDGEAINLLTLDPVVVAAGGGVDGDVAAQVLAAGIQVQNAIVQISALLAGAGATDAENAVVSELANLVAAGTTVDLASATTMETLVNDSANTATGVDSSDINAVAADAAAVVAASNGEIDAALDSTATGVDLLTDLAQVAVVAQGGTVTDALDDAGSSNDSDVIDDTFTDTLVESIPDAVVGDVSGGQNGTPGDDTMVGTAGNDLMDGLAGNDVLFGLEGWDTLRGGAGDDTLNGGATADLLTPASFLDLDRADYSTAIAGVEVNLTDGKAYDDGYGDVDTLIGIEGVTGSNYADMITGSDTFFEFYIGGEGNDTIHGGLGNDRAIYSAATGAITVNLGSGDADNPNDEGTVDGNSSSVGIDTLTGVEQVRGTEFADTFTVLGFISSSQVGGFNSTFNSLEGHGGNDTITGNGNTRVSYQLASEAVTVNLVAATPGVGGSSGTGVGGASVGTDTFSGVSQVQGSAFADTMTGGTATTTQQFEGRGGDDSFDGGSGFDIARYAFDGAISTGLTVNMAAGIVTGDSVLTGTDELRSIESIQGSVLGDVYDATGYGAIGALNVSNSHGTFNEFEGMAGNDTVIGNGNTRVNYISAREGVTVDLDSTNATNASGVTLVNGVAMVGGNVVVGSAVGGASVGTDTINGGVVQIRGSNFDDSLTGTNNVVFVGGNPTFPYTEFYQGRAGDDTIIGGGGPDHAAYNEDPTAAGIVVDMATIDPDTLLFNPARGTVSGDSWIGNDVLIGIIVVRGTNFADTYDATLFDSGLPGLGTFNGFEGGGGDDTITGNTNTRADYFNAGSAVTAVFSAPGVGVADGLSTGHDTFTGGVRSIRGSIFADSMTGAGGNESFEGRDGNDTLIGGAGNDTLNSGNGNDSMTGGIGADIVNADGTGSDTIIFGNIDEFGDAIHNFNAGAGGDVLKISDLLDVSTDYADGAGGALADYVQIIAGGGGHGVLQIDTDGAAAGATWQTLATFIGGSSLSLQTLLDNNNILVS